MEKRIIRVLPHYRIIELPHWHFCRKIAKTQAFKGKILVKCGYKVPKTRLMCISYTLFLP